MIATSGNRPGRAGRRTSSDPGSGLARRRRESQRSFTTAFPGLLPFEASSGCQKRPSHRGAGPAGALSFPDNRDGALGGLPNGRPCRPLLLATASHMQR